MTDLQYLKFIVETINSIINKLEDILWKCDNPENIKRIEKSLENLKKTFCYLQTITCRKEL